MPDDSAKIQTKFISPCCGAATIYSKIERAWICQSCGAKGKFPGYPVFKPSRVKGEA